MQDARRILTALLALAALLVVAGCSSLGPRGAAPASVERAESLARQGRPAEAAKLYERLADSNSGATAAELRLSSARAWVAARRPDEAALALSTIVSGATPAQLFERDLVAVEITLLRGDTGRAWRGLEALPAPEAGPAALRYYGLRERVAFASGQPVEAVRAQLAREASESPEQIHASRSDLLTGLRDAAERGVRFDPGAARDATVRGWLELGPIAAAAAARPMSLGPQLRNWRARYPGHPASAVIASDLEQRPASGPVSGSRDVALLLPLTGRQALAAAQIQDGFLTAWYASTQRPVVRIYDTTDASIADVMQRATSEGAGIIVGPLLREEVVGAAATAMARPPLLALNFLPADRPAPEGFYQFALSPENEARLIARRLLSQGLTQGVALVPTGEWGARVLTAFNEALVSGGGRLVGSEVYISSDSDFSGPINAVLRLDESRARHRRLESVLGMQLEFEPRRRGDAQFIFAPAQAQAARQLRPQLRFYYAGDLPTYSTSDAYEPSPTANLDLQGLVFPDMPWVLGDYGLVTEVRSALEAAWGEGGARRGKLFAFGYDAWQLTTALLDGRDTLTAPIEGLTGTLSLDPMRRVHRDLEWAQIREGVPVLLDRSLLAPPPQSAPPAAPQGVPQG